MFPQNAIPLIPQQAPFVMVDQLLFADETKARTSFTITDANVFTVAGFFQEGGLLENMAQTAAAHAGYNAILTKQPVKPGFIGAVKNLNVVNLPPTGSKLETDVTIENQIFDVFIVLANVWCKNELIASCEMKIFILGEAA